MGTGPEVPDDAKAGEAFVDALTQRDFVRLEACLGPGVRLRALVPSGLREREGASEAAVLFRSWFEGVEHFEILERRVGVLAGRVQVHYRLRERYPDGEFEVIEQNAFCDVEDGRIASMDLVCSGHLPEPKGSPATVQRFDAGDMGCGSGLPQEFRRQIQALPVGGTLEVHVRDPSAKEDLPALARLLGHKVVSVQESTDGTTIVNVARGG